jgi:7-carboxy-7-deazaguanine synthase
MTGEACLRVSELFGPTLQGEGPSAGQLASFIRLSGCNLSCQRCDTPYTWDWRRYDRRTEQHDMRPATVLAWALSQPARLIVVTGGEPLLQARQLAGVVPLLVEAGRRVEFETNGTIAPLPALAVKGVAFNVSPKLAAFGSGMAAGRRIRGGALRALAGSGNARFKFVAAGPADLEEIAALQAAYGLDPVWVMPEGTSSTAVLGGMRLLAEEVIARGWNLSTRLHDLLWEDARGR